MEQQELTRESDPLDRGNVPAGAARIHLITLRLKRLLDAEITHTLSRHSDLSLTEWRMISVLSRSAEVMSQKQIVRGVVIAQGQASRALFALQNQGLVDATQSKSDRRSWDYKLSQKGEATFARLLPFMEERRAALESAVSKEELLQFEEIAVKVARVAKERLA